MHLSSCGTTPIALRRRPRRPVTTVVSVTPPRINSATAKIDDEGRCYVERILNEGCPATAGDGVGNRASRRHWRGGSAPCTGSTAAATSAGYTDALRPDKRRLGRRRRRKISPGSADADAVRLGATDFVEVSAGVCCAGRTAFGGPKERIFTAGSIPNRKSAERH